MHFWIVLIVLIPLIYGLFISIKKWLSSAQYSRKLWKIGIGLVPPLNLGCVSLILYVPAICWLEFSSVCKPSAKNSHKISQFAGDAKCDTVLKFLTFIIVLIFEGNLPSHFANVSKNSISPQNLKGVHHHVLPVFLLSSVVNFNSTLEGDSPSYFAFVLTILILLWNSKTDHHRISILFRMQNEGKKSNSFCKETFPLFHLQLWRFVKFWHQNKGNFCK